MTDLNPRQQAAVDAGPVDLFISAGAGSGKTRVLSARFVSAILGESPYEPSDPGDLLAVTFTEKAAAELAERVRGALSGAGDAAAARAMGDAWISTIHGMCSRILRRHAFAAGVDPHFRVLDQIEASALEAEALETAIGQLTPAEEMLFDAYGFDVVTAAERDIRSSMRSLGLGADDVCTFEPDAMSYRLIEIARELDSVAAAFSSLRTLKTVETNASCVRCAADALGSALSVAPPDAPAILARVTASGTRCLSSVDGLDELVIGARALIEEARSCAAQLAVRPYEAALLSFMRRCEMTYAALKVQRGALDFEDLQIETVRLLETCPDIAEEYRVRFKMLMVDEFQDTNALQLRIAERLSRANLCTVGDENQSIYAFRHADVEVFRERARRVRDSRQLDINYRTAPPLLKVINGIFSHGVMLGRGYMCLQPPPDSVTRPTWPEDQARLEARFIDWSDARGMDAHQVEAECIADRVAELVASGVEPGDTAVLMRALAGGRAAKVERALLARGIPVYLASGGAYFDCPEIIQVRALLRVIDNVRDDAALTTVLAGLLTGLSADGLVTLRELADAACEVRGQSRRDAHLWDALLSPELALGDEDGRAARRTVEAVSRARRMRGIRPLSETVLEPLLDLDADIVLFAAESGGSRAWANVAKLARLAAEYESAVGGDLGGFLEYLDLRELHAKGEQEATLDGEFEAVRIMSIHAAKGLEFGAVVVGGLGAGRDVPGVSIGRVDGQPLLGMVLQSEQGPIPTLASVSVRHTAREAADAEAIRLFYVACTRAREGLTVVARTNPAKDADETLPGLLRKALGMGGADTLSVGDVGVGAGVARVTLTSPTIRDEASTAPGEPVRSADDRFDGPVAAVADTDQPSGAAAGTQTEGAVPVRVSYTGLATYGRCPYRFYLTSIARLPAPPVAQGGEALAFGSAVHATLERMRTRADDPSAAIASAAEAAGLARTSLPRLEAAISAYLSLRVASEVFESTRVMREVPIAVPLAGTTLVGAADVIAWTGDLALIVDYKTGSGVLDAEEARARYLLQGQCYALAVLSAGASAVRVVFAELERGREISYEYVAADRESIEEQVGAIVLGMSEVGFPALDSYDESLCETCPGLGGMCAVSRPSAGGAG